MRIHAQFFDEVTRAYGAAGHFLLRRGLTDYVVQDYLALIGREYLSRV